MGWKHILVEGHCLFDIDDKLDIPMCFKFKPGYIGRHCLDSENDDLQRCSYFAFGSAKSTVVLTDSNGDAIACEVFWPEKEWSNNEEWNRLENKWIEEWRGKLKE